MCHAPLGGVYADLVQTPHQEKIPDLKTLKKYGEKIMYNAEPKDFIGTTVYHTSTGNSLLFGKVKAQSMRDKWLWFLIDWEDVNSPVHRWQKAAHVGTFKVEDLISRIRAL